VCAVSRLTSREALATVALPTIEEAQNGALGDLVPASSEALDAELRSNELFGFPVLNTVSIPPFTRERGTTAITYLDFGLDVGQGEQLDVAARVADRAQRADPDGFAGVTGVLPAR
jgi:hypothetical protein